MLQKKFRPRMYGVEATRERELMLRVEAGGVPTYRQSIPSIFAELRRCRRYEHPMAVLVVGLDVTRPVGAAAAHASTSTDLMLFLVLGALLRDVTRESDIVTYAGQEHVYAVFLPESDAAAAVRAARRLAAAFHARTGGRVRAGVAVFPGNGLIVDALFDHALRSYTQAASVPIDAGETTEDDAWLNVRSAR